VRWGLAETVEVRAAVCQRVPDHGAGALHQIGPGIGRAAVNVDIAVDGDDL